MIRNYLTVTLRNLKKNKWFSLINIVGLTIGITASLVIYLYIDQELSFDNFHQKEIYRITRSSENAGGVEYSPAVPYPLINALHADFNTIKNATQIHIDNNPQVAVENEKFLFEQTIFADSNFFDVFDFKVLSGNPKNALAKPNLAFLTASSAKLLFGDEDPVGKKLRVRNKLDVEVAGIVADPPVNSHIQFEMITSYPSFLKDNYFGLPTDSWTMSAEGYAYVELNESSNDEDIQAEFQNLFNKYYTEEQRADRKFYLQPIEEIRFDKKWNNAAVSTNSLIALGVIGAFILIIGCVNFINLTTAISVKKSKEVGVRKTLGAGRAQLIGQYLADTFIITIFSGLLSIAIAERLLPSFNQFFDKQLTFNVLEDIHVLGFVFILIILVTLAAGLYPSLVLSAFNPVKALKNNMHSQNQSSLFLRKGLIIIQFFISQVLIIATIVIATQMNYFTEKPLGFTKEAVIDVNFDDNSEVMLERFRDQLLANDAIKSVSFALGAPMSDNTFQTSYYLTSNGRDSKFDTQLKPADYFYNEVYDIKLLHGRWFTPAEDKLARDIFNEKVSGDNIPYILNETAVKKLGFSNPEEALGQMITTGLGDFNAPIIGVVEDFHSNSLQSEIVPLIITKFPSFYYNAGIKIDANKAKAAIQHIEKVHQNLFPDIIFSYNFLDEKVHEFYEEEQRTFNLFKIFSGISIFISCLGLLGLISFIVNQRTKEVGVRKVLGADISNIVLLFSKDFLLLVIMAFVLSAPVAWYVMEIWLNDFAYRVDMQVWFFVVAFLLSGVITFVTVSYQSFRAAIENPVIALRSE